MAANDFTGFGFAVGSVFGQRSWVIDRLGRLSSVVHDETPWRPGVNEATCTTKKLTDRILHTTMPSWTSLMGSPSFTYSALSAALTAAEPPKDQPTDDSNPDDGNHIAGCSCGFYAYFDKQQNAYADSPKGVSVEGVIEGFGKTVLGDRGFRAEKARIVALTLPKPKNVKAHWLTRKLYQASPSWRLAAAVPAWLAFICGTMLSVVDPADHTPPAARTLLALAAGAGAYVVACALRSVDYTPPRSRNREKLFALVRRNYPDVKFYDTTAEMYAAHPLTQPPEDTLDPTSEEFWTRKV